MTYREEIWNKAEKRLYEIYGDDPALSILNRFLTEKMALAHFGAAEYFDELASIIKASIDVYNEKLIAKNTVSCCFTAYLLGASEINPLPMHYYCKTCQRVEWVEDEKCLFDMRSTRRCECGAEMRIDGYDIPWETYLPYAQRLKLKDPVPENYKDLFEALTKKHFQLLGAAQAVNLLGQSTGVSPDEISLNDREVRYRLLGGNFSCMHPKLAEFLKQAYPVAKPSNYYELIKLISFAHATHAWKNNSELLIAKGVCNIKDIPASRDEVYTSILNAMRKHNIYDTGFALDVSDKVCRGYYREYGMDEFTASTLKKLGFADWFSEYLSRVHYIAPKALAVLELRTFLTLAWYRIYYKSLFLDFTKDFC